MCTFDIGNSSIQRKPIHAWAVAFMPSLQSKPVYLIRAIQANRNSNTLLPDEISKKPNNCNRWYHKETTNKLFDEAQTSSACDRRCGVHQLTFAPATLPLSSR